MNDFSFDDDGYPRIYTIHSQKGGVGKTSIALALAGMTGARGKKTLIIDADMTGASVADVPGMECESGPNSKRFNELILAKRMSLCGSQRCGLPLKRIRTRFCNFARRWLGTTAFILFHLVQGQRM
jgi:hypothetical protein